MRKIISIEDSPAAVEDALVNGESYTNLQFVQGRTENVLLDLEDHLDGVILDPSRKGCHPEVLNTLIKIKPSSKYCLYILIDLLNFLTLSIKLSAEKKTIG